MNENTTLGQITQLFTDSPPPRSMAFQAVLPQLTQELVDANKRIDELDATLDKVQNSWLDAKLRIDQLTTALRQLIAQINTSTTVIDKRFSLDGIVHVDYVTALTDLLNGRNEAQKVLNDAPANVSAEVDPFGAEVAADLDCTEKDVYEYAVDSVGASEIKTIEGCHSAGLHNCYGDLWTCKGCGNQFCDAEGSDDGFIDFCDDCWAKMQGDAK